ncbi:SWIB/MDM2 domain-containing protein [Thamnidium elegans]|nr:SWIB/MDM2 domain-containing protein [Thamnidium elegans]
MDSSNDMLFSDLLFSWGSNNNNNNNIYDNPLSSSTVMTNELLVEDSSLFAMNSNLHYEALNQYQEPFNCNNDNTFYDLFPQEKLQFIINDNTEPSSSQLMLHQQPVYTNHSLIVEPFTDNKPQVVVQKKSNSNKRKKAPAEQDSNKQQERKKPKKKKKKKEDVDPNAPPKPKRITGLNKPLLLSNSLQVIMEGAAELSRPEIVKRLWNYIKSNQLQDPADRRFILCDEKLKSIFQKDRVNSFGMNRDLSAHLTKKEVPCTQESSITPSIISNTNQSLMIEDFSPVPTAETPDIMTPSDSEIFLQKWCSSL